MYILGWNYCKGLVRNKLFLLVTGEDPFRMNKGQPAVVHQCLQVYIQKKKKKKKIAKISQATQEFAVVILVLSTFSLKIVKLSVS